MESRPHIGRVVLAICLATVVGTGPAEARRHRARVPARSVTAAPAAVTTRAIVPAGYSGFDMPLHEIHARDYRTASVVESSSVRRFGPIVRIGWEMTGGEVDGSVRNLTGQIRVHGSLQRLFERLDARPADTSAVRPQ